MSSLALALFAALLPAADPTPPPLPLPPGAVVRFGSSRFWTDGHIGAVCYSPDSRTLLAAVRYQSGPLAGKSRIMFWDAATGVKRYESAAEEGEFFGIVCAPDGRTVAAYDAKNERFPLFEAKTGKLLRHIGEAVHGCPTFSPDGKMLAGATQTAIVLWDIATGKEVQWLGGNGKSVFQIAYSPNGRLLGSVADDHTLHVWDVASGKILFQQIDKERDWTFVDFSADSRSVAATVVSAKGPDYLVVWNIDEKREVWREAVRTRFGGFGFLADGKSVVVVGMHGAEVREAATGKLRLRFQPAECTLGRAWAISPDGRSLALGGDGSVVHQWDLATGKDKDESPGHRYGLTAVAVAPDGRAVLTQDRSGALRLWDPATGRELRRFQQPADSVVSSYFTAYGWSPYFCCGTPGLDELRLVEIETGRVRHCLKNLGHQWSNLFLYMTANSADGKVLVFAGQNLSKKIEMIVEDTATGKKRKSLEKVPYNLLAFTVSADGKQVAGSSVTAIQLWNAATGRESLRLPLEKEPSFDTLHFSADGRWLLAFGSSYDQPALGMWEIETGRQVPLTRIENHHIVAASLSPDGRTVAVSLQNRHPRVVPATILLETATGQERCRLNGLVDVPFIQSSQKLGTAFTPDGRSLITISEDATALVWSLPYRGGDKSAPSRAAELVPLWAALANPEAPKAYQAIAALAAAPDLAVSFLRERLRPVPLFDDKAKAELARSILDLDSDNFETREKAAAALERLQELAEPALRKTLANSLSAEVRRHIAQLLDKLNTHPPSGETLRTIRAIETLELIGTPAAQKLLADLARGAPEARQTHEASISLARLRMRKAK